VTEPNGHVFGRRLTRSRTDRKIAGIAAGIANYSGIDPVWIRVLFLVLLFTGPGFLLYLICWVAIPEEPVRTASHPVPAMTAPNPAPVATRRADHGDSGRLLLGGLLIIGGAYLGLASVLPRIRGLLLPAILVAAGVAVIVYGARR